MSFRKRPSRRNLAPLWASFTGTGPLEALALFPAARGCVVHRYLRICKSQRDSPASARHYCAPSPASAARSGPGQRRGLPCTPSPLWSGLTPPARGASAPNLHRAKNMGYRSFRTHRLHLCAKRILKRLHGIHFAPPLGQRQSVTCVSGTFCYLCVAARTKKETQPTVGFEPTTCGLRNRCSTTELRRHNGQLGDWSHYIRISHPASPLLKRHLPTGLSAFD